MITKEREYELIAAAQAGDTVARDELFNAHKNFIWLQAIRKKPQYSGHEREDLAQQIWLEMINAVDRFDLNSGVRFLTYAGFFVSKAMNVCFENNSAVRYPRSATCRDRHYGIAVMSLEIDVSNDRTETPVHTLSPIPEFILDVESEEDVIKVRSCLSQMQERDRHVLLGRADGKTLDVIGDELGITGERARQLETRAMAQLKELYQHTPEPKVIEPESNLVRTVTMTVQDLIEQVKQISPDAIEAEINRLEEQISLLRRVQKLIQPDKPKTTRRPRGELLGNGSVTANGIAGSTARGNFLKLGKEILEDDTCHMQVVAGVVSTTTEPFRLRDIEEMIPLPAISTATIRIAIKKMAEAGCVVIVPNTGTGSRNPAMYVYKKRA